MIIGIPKEIMDNEYRVALTPAGVRELVAHGHEVLVEKDAGEGSNMLNEHFEAAGGKIIKSRENVFEKSEMIVKVKAPLPEEIALLKENQVVFAFLHLAAARELTIGLMKSRVVAIAYETVQLPNRNLPLLTAMSEIAGRMAPQIGAHFLEKMNGGRGVLLGGVPGVSPGKVLIMGGGIVGSNSALVASGMEAEVCVIDKHLDKLRYLDSILFGRVRLLASNAMNIEEEAARADLLIGAVLIPGAKTPRLVTENTVKSMKKGSVIVDVSVDQGGCIETIRATTHSEPVYEKHGVLHYAVPNIPGSVPRTSTSALSNVTLPYILKLADLGFRKALRLDTALALGANIVEGKITNRAVGEAHGLEYFPISSIIPLETY